VSIKSPEPSQYVVLHDIPWEMYEAILEALPEHHLRHTYDRGVLELRSLIDGVSWEQYEALLEACGDHYFAHTYDRGWLEILMSPRLDHDWVKKFLGRMVETISSTLKIRIKSIGSTTVTRRSVRRGLQPDEGYYIANEPAVRFKMTFDSAVDPPPDLVIEVDVTSKSIKRMPVYAALRVPEIWRHDGSQLYFYGLHRAKYRKLEQSVAFPFLSPDDLMRFLNQLTKVDEMTLLDSFATWVRRQAKNRRNDG
jgi:Uma2 family endonuclease